MVDTGDSVEVLLWSQPRSLDILSRTTIMLFLRCMLMTWYSTRLSSVIILTMAAKLHNKCAVQWAVALLIMGHVEIMGNVFATTHGKELCATVKVRIIPILTNLTLLQSKGTRCYILLSTQMNQTGD